MSEKKHREPKTPLQRFWHFIWYEDSVASWIVSIALAFVLIKFIIYPALGLVFGTQFPVVAVVSNSMEHEGSFDEWWHGSAELNLKAQEDLYLEFNITKNEFREYTLRNGFNKGDIIVLFGAKPENVERGDIIVYWGGKNYPIIHRVVAIGYERDGTPYFQTKGDHNRAQIIPDANNCCLDERHIAADQLVGRAAMRIPYLGWVKIGFVNFLNWIGIPAS